MKFSFALFLLFFFVDAFSQTPDYKRINENLDNYAIQKSREDLENFKWEKPIFSVRVFATEDRKNNPKPLKKIQGKNFYLQSYTEYLKDGRKRYKEYNYDYIDRVDEYFYDDKTQNLTLSYYSEKGTETFVENYALLYYDDAHILDEEIDYRTYKGTDFDYEGYAKYSKDMERNALKITISEVGYDTIPDPKEYYYFDGDNLTKFRPQYRSRKEKFQWISGKYRPTESENYVVEGRDVKFFYDQNGYLTEERWVENGNNVERMTQYKYTDNYATRIKNEFYAMGTEATTTTQKFNKNGDIIFEQVKYPSEYGTPKIFEYVYDDFGNWKERISYYLNKETNKKENISHEIREIKYFGAKDKIRELIFPEISNQIDRLGSSIMITAQEKQNKIDDFNQAVETGNFPSEITIKKAKNLEDFTPEFWEISRKTYGNLDEIDGDEAVVVYKTPISDDFGYAQVLGIFKKSGDEWELWHQSSNPILSDQAGGMMGNPFESISIANRSIVITHFGGSRAKWSYKHRYRFQNNNWYLIGATVGSGAPCDDSETLDYNLSTGDAVASFTHEICNSGDPVKVESKSWKKSFKTKIPLPLMDGFVPGSIKIIIPDKNYEMYY